MPLIAYLSIHPLYHFHFISTFHFYLLFENETENQHNNVGKNEPFCKMVVLVLSWLWLKPAHSLSQAAAKPEPSQSWNKVCQPEAESFF
jgi:hypothetical protein